MQRLRSMKKTTQTFDSNHNLLLTPIAFLKSNNLKANDLPRQVNGIGLSEEIIFNQKTIPPSAFEDLKGFSHIWIIFGFHQNSTWKPKVQPPRGGQKKRSVLATRSPYRPNPIGISCAKLISVLPEKLIIQSTDLINNSPIYDIKPYIKTYDSITDSSLGWISLTEQDSWEINWSPRVLKQIDWLAAHGIHQIQSVIENNLKFEPTNSLSKRIYSDEKNSTLFQLGYKTWRITFSTDLEKKSVYIVEIISNYTKTDLLSSVDIYQDKDLHQNFKTAFSEEVEL